jgi:hypothetical protein
MVTVNRTELGFGDGQRTQLPRVSIPVVGCGVRHVETSGSAAKVLGLNSSLTCCGKINAVWLFLWQDFCC